MTSGATPALYAPVKHGRETARDGLGAGDEVERNGECGTSIDVFHVKLRYSKLPLNVLVNL